MGRQLLIYRERIEGVSLSLRRLAAEVADGAPTLVWSDRFDPEHGEMSLGQARFDSLALGQARYLHRALRQVPTLLEATNSGRANETHDGTRGQLSESDADPVEDDLTATTQAVAGAQPPTASDAVTGSPPGDREDQVVDLRALARHATAFTDELERAWSAALDSVLLAEAQQEMGARYESLLRTIARRAAAADRALSTAGVDPGLPAHPLQPDELARLTFDPMPKQRWLQRQLAEIDTLTTLLEALKAISAPSAHVIHVHKQRVESWWEAGAFALIRDCADLLLRVSEQVASAEAELTGTSVTPTPPPAFVGRLQLASAALRHGDIEAVLMHARLALRLRAAVEHDVVPDDLLARLTQDGRLADDATVLRLLDQAASRLAAGEELDIGAAMLLAPRALAVVHRLCLQTPQIILSALEKGSGHAGS
jgi:hypothetical protein